MNFKIVLGAIAFAASATPVQAWVVVSDKGGCGLHHTFEDGTNLQFIQSKEYFDDRVIAVYLSNDAWSISEGENVPGGLTAMTDLREIARSDAVIVPTNHTIMSAFYEEDFRYFDRLEVENVTFQVGSKTLLIANWSGFVTAFHEFRECREQRGWNSERLTKDAEAEQIERDKKYRERVPVDPFATAPG